MSEICLVTSSKDSGGIGVIDATTGAVACSNFKNCIAEPGCICLLGKGTNSYSGRGSSGDFIAVAQSKKPVVNIWEWNKPAVRLQCHIQEILETLASDSTGTYLYGGTKRGWIYLWDTSSGVLLHSWQAHFKVVTKIVISTCGNYCISGSQDGIVRVWDISSIFETIEIKRSSGSKASLNPMRSWNAHSLSVSDLVIIGSLQSPRVVSCSVDRTIVIHDLFTGRQSVRVSSPYPLESLAVNATEDFLFAGSSSGPIVMLDLSIVAIGLSAAHAQVISGNSSSTAATVSISSLTTATTSSQHLQLPPGMCLLEGHTKSVRTLTCSGDNSCLISGSEDGSVRFWHCSTRQCVRDIKPLSKLAITNVLIVARPEILTAGDAKPSLAPIEHLRKYPEDSNGQSHSTRTAPSSVTATASSATPGKTQAAHCSSDVLGPCVLGCVTHHHRNHSQHSRDTTTAAAAAAGGGGVGVDSIFSSAAHKLARVTVKAARADITTPALQGMRAIMSNGEDNDCDEACDRLTASSSASTTKALLNDNEDFVKFAAEEAVDTKDAEEAEDEPDEDDEVSHGEDDDEVEETVPNDNHSHKQQQRKRQSNDPGDDNNSEDGVLRFDSSKSTGKDTSGASDGIGRKRLFVKSKSSKAPASSSSSSTPNATSRPTSAHVSNSSSNKKNKNKKSPSHASKTNSHKKSPTKPRQ